MYQQLGICQRIRLTKDSRHLGLRGTERRRGGEGGRGTNHEEPPKPSTEIHPETPFATARTTVAVPPPPTP